MFSYCIASLDIEITLYLLYTLWLYSSYNDCIYVMMLGSLNYIYNKFFSNKKNSN